MRGRLYVAAVLAAIAIILILAFVVLEFGVDHPSPGSLRDTPRDEIPGSILYFDQGGCIVDATASGRRSDRVVCPLSGSGYVGTVTWVDEKTIAYAAMDAGGNQAPWHWVRVDLATKRETTVPGTTVPPAPTADTLSVRNERISFDPDGYLYRASGSERVRIYRLPDGDGGGVNQFAFVTWSPDGEWFLLRYYPKSELWIVRRDGLVAGTLASDVRDGGSWLIPGTGILPPVDASLKQTSSGQ